VRKAGVGDTVVDKFLDTAVAEPEEETIVRPRRREHEQEKNETRRQPRYHVILWNDEDHSYDYVINMLQSLFGHPPAKGIQIASTVDRTGRAICLTTTMEHAELKRDQIHAYGKDYLICDCAGSMSATIEPEC